MTKIPRAALFLAAALAGCGGPPASLAPPSPHGGMLFKLADGQSNLEVVRQDVPGQPGQSRLLVYLLGADLKPKANPPAAATFKSRGRGTRPIDLKPTGEADPAKAGELASGPIPGDVDLGGEIAATIDGKALTIPVNIR